MTLEEPAFQIMPMARLGHDLSFPDGFCSP